MSAAGNIDRVKNIVRLVLEKHLRAILGSMNAQEMDGDPGGCAARVEAAAAKELDKMGLAFVSLSIQGGGKPLG